METKHLTAKEIEAVEKEAIKSLKCSECGHTGSCVFAYDVEFCKDKDMQNVALMGAEFLAELRIEESPSEELVEQVLKILDNNSYQSIDEKGLTGKFQVSDDNFKDVATEIANLPQIRANSSKICKVNEELLEALEKIANAPYPENEFEYCVFHEVARNIANNAIQNAKTQTK